MAGDFGLHPLRISKLLDVITIFQRHEMGQRPLNNLQSMAVKTKVLDDLGVEQSDGIRTYRIAEAGVKLFRDRCATNGAAALDNFDFESSASQIGSTGKAVVASTDNNHIVSRGFCVVHRYRRFNACGSYAA